jgi:iron complex transport system ATP-binding protein
MKLTFAHLVCRLGGKEVLKGISGEIEPGKLTAILGANGCGKSTWLRALLGLVDLQSGNVSGLPDFKGYLPQKKEIHWPLTCEAVVELGNTPAASEATQTIMARLGIAHIKEKRIDEVSGGERTLVLLARVLRDRPKLIVADEPIAELDPKYQVEVMRLLKEEADRGAIVLVTMHDIGLTERFAQHIFLMKEGLIMDQGDVKQVLNQNNLENLFGVRFEEKKGFYVER